MPRKQSITHLIARDEESEGLVRPVTIADQSIEHLLNLLPKPVDRDPLKAGVEHAAARYELNLRGDELAASRADIAAGLRRVRHYLDRILDAVAALGETERNLVAAACTSSSPWDAAPARTTAEQLSADLLAIALLIDDVHDLAGRMTAGLVPVMAPVMALDKALQSFRPWHGLDLQSEGLVLDSYLPSPGVVHLQHQNTFACRLAQLSQYRAMLDLAIDTLDDQHGPDPRVAFGILVEQLALTYEALTGQVLTHNRYKKTVYCGAPQSTGGRFVAAAVRVVAITLDLSMPLVTTRSGVAAQNLPLRATIHRHRNEPNGIQILDAPATETRAVSEALRDFVAARKLRPAWRTSRDVFLAQAPPQP